MVNSVGFSVLPSKNLNPKNESNDVNQYKNNDSSMNGNSHSLIKDYAEYKRLHAQSINDPGSFWMPIISQLYWKNVPTLDNLFRQNLNINKGDIVLDWMKDGLTNICFNCVDRHVLAGYENDIAFHWTGNEIDEHVSVTYSELLRQVCIISNALVNAGVKPNDAVGVYLGMCPEVISVMLAIARVGAIHVVIFGGYSYDALSKRLCDTNAKLLFTIDGSYRGSKFINMKTIAIGAINLCKQRNHIVEQVVVKDHLNRLKNNQSNNNDVSQKSENELSSSKLPSSTKMVSLEEFIHNAKDTHEPFWRNGNDTLFILHTSGSTGAPKGIEHSIAGYMVYAYTTFRYSFDACKDSDVFFCTGDVGWITGHTYNCYGPLLNHKTFVMFEGIPLYPDPGRYWQICEQYKVTHFYTAPTAIRACLAHGNDFVNKYDLSKLRILGSVGEPLNDSAWKWLNDVVGKNKCPIIDTYFQTETGGHVITNLPYILPAKPGCAFVPFFGTEFAIVDDCNNELKEDNCEGHLVMKQCGPGMMKGIYNRPEDFAKIYFSKFKGYYFTGDGAKRDSQGFYWITGRIDDMMNCSGHLLSSSEIESIISSHPKVSECSVIGVPHSLKAETPYAFVVLKMDVILEDGFIQPTKEKYSNSLDKSVCNTSTGKNKGVVLTSDTELRRELRNSVRKHIGPFAMPETIIFCTALPKTRSGKILRRVMRTISSGGTSLGDLSALTDSSVIDELYKHVAKVNSN